METRILPLLALLASGCTTTDSLPPDGGIMAHLAAAGSALEAIAANLGPEPEPLTPAFEASYRAARSEARAAARLAGARAEAALTPAGRRVARAAAQSAAACEAAIARLEARHREAGLSRGLFHLSATAETCAAARETGRNPAQQRRMG
ncbi:hypothetical protein [Thermaurantiacus sp.]